MTCSRRPQRLPSGGATAPSCEELLQATAAGDARAFDALYRREFRAVQGLAFGLLRDSFQAEEVAQEVMLAIWQRAAQFDASLGPGHAWIMRMTRSKAIDRIRTCEHDRIRDDQFSRQTRDAPPAVTDTVFARHEAGRVQGAMLQLSTQQREALTLAFFSHLSYPQIATHLDLPLGTVKTRIRDGLNKLRRTMCQPNPESILDAA